MQMKSVRKIRFGKRGENPRYGQTERRMQWDIFKKYIRREIPHRCVTVYMYLKDRTGREGTCWPAIGTIARDEACRAAR